MWLIASIFLLGAGNLPISGKNRGRIAACFLSEKGIAFAPHNNVMWLACTLPRRQPDADKRAVLWY